MKYLILERNLPMEIDGEIEDCITCNYVPIEKLEIILFGKLSEYSDSWQHSNNNLTGNENVMCLVFKNGGQFVFDGYGFTFSNRKVCNNPYSQELLNSLYSL